MATFQYTPGEGWTKTNLKGMLHSPEEGWVQPPNSVLYSPGDIEAPLLAGQQGTEAPLVEGQKDSGKEHLGHDSGKGGFEYVFAIRLPKAVKDKERVKFKKFMEKVYKDKTVEEVIRSFIVDKDALAASDLKCAGTDDDLQAALNCTIEMLLSFFKTLGDSHKQHMKIFVFNSIEVNKVFIATRMGHELGETLADMAEYPVQLSVEGIANLNIKISDQTDLMPAYVKYDKQFQDRGLIHNVSRSKMGSGGHESIIRHIDKVRLLYDKITDYIDIGNLQKMYQPLDITFKVYPAHEEDMVQELRTNWANFRRIFDWNQPIQDIRNYFGEGVAYYFMFGNFIRQSLLILFILCCPFYYSFGDDPWIDTMYSFLITVWYTVTVKLWRRHEAYYANYWGCDYNYSGMTVKERVNPDFVGEVKPSIIDENILAMAPDEDKRRKGLIRSVCVTTLYILLGTCCVVVNRLLATHLLGSYASTLLAIQIKVFDLLWMKIGKWLADQEELVELRDLHQSQSLKYSIFLTFNTFQGFIWIAYVQPHLANQSCAGMFPAPHDEAPGCFRWLLRQSITSAFPILIFFSALGMAFPFWEIMQKYKKQKTDLKELEKKNAEKPEAERTDFVFYQISSFEEQTKKMEYLGEDSMYDYTQVLSSLSWVALFGPVNPVPIVGLAWFAITVQQRVDSIRLCSLYQRTFPERIANIGVWDSMLGALRYFCVMNVVGLLSTNPRVDLAVLLGILPESVAHLARNETAAAHVNGTYNATINSHEVVAVSGALLWVANQFATVLVFSIMMFVVWASDKVIPDESAIITREKARQAHQRAKIFDVDEGEFTEKVVMTGDGDYEKSAYENVAKLEPDTENYVAPIPMTIC